MGGGGVRGDEGGDGRGRNTGGCVVHRVASHAQRPPERARAVRREIGGSVPGYRVGAGGGEGGEAGGQFQGGEALRKGRGGIRGGF
jgi:hypothetical protein